LGGLVNAAARCGDNGDNDLVGGREAWLCPTSTRDRRTAERMTMIERVVGDSIVCWCSVGSRGWIVLDIVEEDWWGEGWESVGEQEEGTEEAVRS
jgi:hypothetical protein